MNLVRRLGGRAGWQLSATVFAAAAATALGCGSDGQGTAPVLPPNPTPNPQITKAAFLADVNVRTGKITIKAPEVSLNSMGGAAIKGPNGMSNIVLPDPDFSLVGGDVVDVTTSNFFASTVGQFQPGKVRVRFDVNLTNKLNGVELLGPTVFPTPPAGTTGPLLFPYAITVATTSGGTSTGGQGNDVIVILPSYGLVAPSSDWNGAPFNFFNDTGCPSGGTTPSDCFPYEEYAPPISPGATTPANTVGFDLDPTVGQFTAALIVAADLHNAGAAPTGTIAGTVSSPQLGNLSGVLVSVTGGFSGSTGAAGDYSISNVNIGPRTVSLSNLPTGCTNPGSQNTTVANGATSTVNFTVTCPVPTGTVSGTISFTGAAPSPTGITVTVTPTGGSALGGVSPNSAGLYTRNNVPVGAGTGSVALSNLPSGCSNPGAGNYSGLTSGGTQTVDFTVACTPPPAGYQYTGSAVDNGATVTITFSINMSTFDDPAISGPENIGVIDGQFTYNSTRLTPITGAPACVSVTGSALGVAAFNANTPGTIVFTSVNTTSAAAGQGTNGVISCTFNDAGGGSFSTATTLFVASDFLGNLDYLAPTNHVLVTEATVP
jgi:hypothetical protein